MFARVAWPARRNHILSGVVSTARERSNVVLRELLGLRSAVSASAFVGGDDGLPLWGGEGRWDRQFAGAVTGITIAFCLWVR